MISIKNTNNNTWKATNSEKYASNQQQTRKKPRSPTSDSIRRQILQKPELKPHTTATSTPADHPPPQIPVQGWVRPVSWKVYLQCVA